MVYDDRGRPKVASAEDADAEWQSNTRPEASRQTGAAANSPESAAPPATTQGRDTGDACYGVPDPEVDYAEARRRREVELWRQASLKREADELDVAAKRGELVSVEQARAAAIEKFAAVKTKVLALPTRIKQRIPHLGHDDVTTISDLVHETLEDLADGGDG